GPNTSGRSNATPHPYTKPYRSKQDAKNKVDHDANSSATSAPGVDSNVNAPVRVASNGSDGDVNQSNGSTANSEAENDNTSTQGIDQGQSSTQHQSADPDASGCCNGSSDDSSQT